MHAAVFDQTGFETNIRLRRLDLERSCCAIFADVDRINTFVPIELSAQNQLSCSRWITETQLADCRPCGHFSNGPRTIERLSDILGYPSPRLIESGSAKADPLKPFAEASRAELRSMHTLL